MITMKTPTLHDDQPGAGGGGTAAPAAAPTSAPAPAAIPAPAAEASVLLSAAEVKPLADSIPEKYRVKNEKGEFDSEASTRKLLEGHSALEKRMGSGDAPPKTPEEYKIEGLPEGISIDELKKDEKYTGFLKAAHGKGMTNAQVSFAINEYLSRAGEVAGASTPQSANAELRKVWADDQSFKANQGAALRAATALSQKTGISLQEVSDSMGNNPIAIRLLAAMGAEMKEDSPPNNTTNANEMNVEALMKEPAYLDSKHPQHEIVKSKVTAHFQSKYGSKPR